MREGGQTVAWAEFGGVVPELESFGRARLERRVAYLATIRADGSPRLHPVSAFIGTGGLFLYMEPTSPKVADLRRDPRYTLHCGVEDDSGGGGEFCVSGRANEVIEQQRRSEAFVFARQAGYRPAERHVLFELRLVRAFSTIYQGGAQRRHWSADEGGR
ncbi:MAG: pyridoxamine 5'-phosphate oxidase family protein [Enhydrobacter sp.]|nr:MAG: pyridoxamine 5'-phosphate oxidase family protein [Enhydrobacter sp.]